MLFNQCTKIDKTSNKDVPIERWAMEYFGDNNKILLSDVSDFCETALGSVYQMNYQSNFNIDTVDVISEFPRIFNQKQLTEYYYQLVNSYETKTNFKEKELAGIVVIPRYINEKLYTRSLILTKSNNISQRSVTCTYSSDYDYSNGPFSSCTNLVAFAELEEKFNQDHCYWPHTYPMACSIGEVRKYAMAPDALDKIYENGEPCCDFSTCFNLTANRFRPECSIPPPTNSICNVLYNDTGVGEDFKLFTRGANGGTCLSISEMNYYQEALGILAQDIRDANHPFLNHIDNSWFVLNVFLRAQSTNSGGKLHEAIFLYEKCVPSFKW